MTDVSRIAKTVRGWSPDLIHIQYPTQGYGQRYLPWLLPTLFQRNECSDRPNLARVPYGTSQT